MNPETLAALIKTAESVAGGGTTGILVLMGLWLYNKKNGKPKLVTEEVCALRNASFQKDIKHIKEGMARVERLVRNGQKGLRTSGTQTETTTTTLPGKTW